MTTNDDLTIEILQLLEGYDETIQRKGLPSPFGLPKPPRRTDEDDINTWLVSTHRNHVRQWRGRVRERIQRWLDSGLTSTNEITASLRQWQVTNERLELLDRPLVSAFDFLDVAAGLPVPTRLTQTDADRQAEAEQQRAYAQAERRKLRELEEQSSKALRRYAHAESDSSLNASKNC